MGKLETFIRLLDIQGWITATVVVLSAAALVTKLLRDWIHLHDAAFTKRPLDRLSHLHEAVRADSPLASFLGHLKEAELFHLATKLRVSPAKAAMIMKIFDTGMFSIRELRLLARHLEPTGDSRVRLTVGFTDKALAWTALTVILGTTSYLAWAVFVLVGHGDLASLSAIPALIALWLGAIFTFRSDVHAYFGARDARERLRAAALLDES